MGDQKAPEKKKESILYGLVCAGSAAVVTVSIIHPVDTVKTRMQVSGFGATHNYKELGILGSMRTIAREEGVLAFWKGIPAAWMREGSYTSIRLGLYKPIKEAMGADKPDSGFLLKLAAGGLAGGLGSIVGNPFDVMKTKMMAAEGKGQSFVSTFQGVLQGQGVGGFYRGIDANIARAVVNNGVKMACYDTIKQKIKKIGVFGKDGIGVQASSSFIAGFIMTLCVAPFDMVRTQLMNQPSEGPRLYNGFLDCTMKVVQQRGPLSLWSGFIPMWGRIAPNAMIQLTLFEQITRLTGGKTM